MLKNVYEGLNVYMKAQMLVPKCIYFKVYFSKVYLSKVYFCEMYPTCVSSKLCEFIPTMCEAIPC